MNNSSYTDSISISDSRQFSVTTPNSWRRAKILKEIDVIPYYIDTVELSPTEKQNLIIKKWSDTENLGIHRPWDELELKGHGLVSKRGEHFFKPLATTDPAQVEEVTSTEKTRQQVSMGTLHLPFDEVAMKMSGYVDGLCRRITDSELERDDVGKSELRHVRIGSIENINVVSQTETAPSTIPPTSDAEALPSRESIRQAFRPPRELVVRSAKISQLDIKAVSGDPAKDEKRGGMIEAGGKRYSVRVEGEIRVRPKRKMSN